MKFYVIKLPKALGFLLKGLLGIK
ncbi:MAG TPA: stage V sporulation protein SpoVM [Firmicutes bacterium]|nr:stage V sporulation protein SpoVM [Bacillota bacterium]